jgi:hypothetical protein
MRRRIAFDLPPKGLLASVPFRSVGGRFVLAKLLLENLQREYEFLSFSQGFFFLRKKEKGFWTRRDSNPRPSAFLSFSQGFFASPFARHARDCVHPGKKALQGGRSTGLIYEPF